MNRQSNARRFTALVESLESRRLLTLGAPDPTFGSGGLAEVSLSTATVQLTVSSGALQRDGKILIAGAGPFVLQRFNPDGTPDPAFGGGDGRTEPEAAVRGVANDVAVGPDGKIVTAGIAQVNDNGFHERILVSRYLPDGSPDPSFGGAGWVMLHALVPNLHPTADAVALQPDGKILVGGGDGFTLALMRLNPDGSPDAGFAAGGVFLARTALPAAGRIADLALQGDGKIVALAAATSTASGGHQNVFCRFNADGSVDTTFGASGLAAVDIPGADEFFRRVLVQDDGKVLGVGSGAVRFGTTAAPPNDFALVRVNVDGSTDAGFGAGGYVLSDLAGQTNLAAGAALDAAGRILVGGHADGRFALARYDPSGALDASLGVGGLLVGPAGADDHISSDLLLQGHGKPVVVGSARSPAAVSAARFDLTFGTASLPAASVLKDITLGESGSSPREMVRSGGLVYFTALSGAGWELWRTDGTAAGTFLVNDVNPFSSSNPGSLTPLNGRLVYATRHGFNTDGLWATDGTDAGSVMLSDRPTSLLESARGAAELGGSLLYTRQDDATNVSLWKTDGTAAGTVQVAALGAVAKVWASSFVTVGGQVMFNVLPAGGEGLELWRSDGTAAGTARAWSVTTPGGGVTGAFDVGGKHVMRVFNGYDAEFWRGDGAAPSPLRAGLDVGQTVPLGGTLLFVGELTFEGPALWKTDGTPGGTVKLRQLASPGDHSGINEEMVAAGGAVFFVTDRMAATTLWRSDGTEGGTVGLLRFPGDDAPFVGGLTAAGGLLYFGVAGHLWRSDGTEAGTFQVTPTDTSFPPGVGNFSATEHGLFFSAKGGSELWKTDGTAAGTAAVAQVPFPAAEGGGVLSAPVALGRTLVFIAADSGRGEAPWKFDLPEEPVVPPPPPGPAPDLTVALQAVLPPLVITRGRGSARVTVTNIGDADVTGPFNVTVAVSADAVLGEGDAVVGTLPGLKGRRPWKPGQARTLRLKFAMPAGLAEGAYQLIAVADAGGGVAESNEGNNTAAGGGVTYERLFADVGSTNANVATGVRAGGGGLARVQLHNQGNSVARGATVARLLVAPAGGGSGPRHLGDVPLRLALRPGATKDVGLKFLVPGDLAPGLYRLIVEIVPAAAWADRDAGDDRVEMDLQVV